MHDLIITVHVLQEFPMQDLKIKKKSKRKIQLIISTSVISILRCVHRQVAENKMLLQKEMMRGDDEELLCSKLCESQK